MSATTVTTESVLLVDLREHAGEPQTWEVLHNDRFRDSGRVLVVDDVATLADHESVFETLMGSRLFDTALVCVAVGPPAGAGSDPVLSMPGSLNVDRALTLWVGDQDGIGWDIGRGRSAAAADVPMPELPPLHTLLDVLRIPEVFDRIIAHAPRFSGRTACPGLLAESSPIKPEDLVSAQAAAMREVAGTARGRTAEPATFEVDLPTVLLGGPERRLADYVRDPVPGSPADQLYLDGLNACRRATDSVEALAGPIGPAFTVRADAWALVAGAGAAAGAFREFVADLFERVGGRAGIDQTQHERLRRLGLVTDPPPESDPQSIAARLQDVVDDALGQRQPLTVIGGRVREFAERAAPMGSGAHLEDLARRCPAEMPQALVRPPEFPFRAFEPWVLAATAGSFLLAGVLHWAAGAALAVLWVAGVLLALWRQPGPPPAQVMIAAAVAGHLVTAAAGVAAGIAVQRAIALPLAACAVAAVVALVGLVVVLRQWWYAAVRRWVGMLGLAGVEGALSQVRRLLMDVVVREWAMTESRRFTADAAIQIAAALTATATVLDRQATELTALDGSGVDPRPSRWTVDGRGSARPQLVDIMVDDVVDAVGSALRPCWEQVRFGPGGDVQHGLAQRLTEVLDEYRAHLRARGLDERPSFVTRSADRSTVLGATWQDSRLVDRIVQLLVAGEPMLQLCSLDDLASLLTSPAGVRLVRFAPQPVRSALAATGVAREPASDLADVAWTRSMHLAGVLRLVPLRGTAVSVVWPTNSDDQDLI